MLPAIQNNHGISENHSIWKSFLEPATLSKCTGCMYALLFLSFNLKINLKTQRRKMDVTKVRFYIFFQSFTLNCVQFVQKLRMLLIFQYLSPL